MNKPIRQRALGVFALLLTLTGSVTAAGQSRLAAGTASDERFRGTITGEVRSVDRGRRSFDVARDEDGSRVRISADDVTTSFRGFSSGGSSDVQRGVNAFDRVQVGDRLQIRGVGGANSTLAATEVTLLGRSAAGGNSRSGRGAETIEGVVRSVDARGNSLVIETADRRLRTVRGASSTPVYFEGRTYRIANIEQGDRLRVRIAPGPADDLRIESIDVLASVGGAGSGSTVTITSLRGTISRIDARTESIRVRDVNDDRDVRVDLRGTQDETRRPIRYGALRVGDVVELTGRYETNGTFVADFLRIGTADDLDRLPRRADDYPMRDDDRYEIGDDRVFRVLEIDATIEEAVSDSVLIVRDRRDGRTLRILVDPNFLVRARTSTVTVRQLRVGERLTIRVFSDEEETMIAQTIDVR